MDPHLKKLQQDITSSTEGMSAEQLTWHPPEKWCVAEILEHLYLTYTGTLKGLSRSLASGTPLASQTTWKNHVQSLIVLELGYLPAGREAPHFARPKGLAAEKVRTQTVSMIAEMDETMSRYATQFGSRTKVLDHVFLGPFSIDQWRKFHLVHGRHHVRQIRKLRSQMRTTSARHVA